MEPAMHHLWKHKFILTMVTLGLINYFLLYEYVTKMFMALPKSEYRPDGRKDQGLLSTQDHPVQSKSVILNLLRKYPLASESYNQTRNLSFLKRAIQQKDETKYLMPAKGFKNKFHHKRSTRNIAPGNKSGNNVYIQNITIVSNRSSKHTRNETTCNYVFDMNSLYKARKQLSNLKSVYLIFIILEAEDMFQHLIKEEQDDLLHWQYVQKKEKFLIQLPIDFDLITYGILSEDNEELVLNLKLIHNNTHCKENFKEAQKSIRKLLWYELFDNASNFYLCNRNFQNEIWRTMLYYITTIWVGYDLNCTEVRLKDGRYSIEEKSMRKDQLPLVAPIFCYMLSLQFVWIFVLFEINKKPQDSNATESNSLSNYYKNDRPYGLKRLILKLLYKECPCKVEGRDREKVYCFYPVKRLLLLTWIFIHLPIGLYRTIGRYVLNKVMYKNYSEVIKPNESAFSMFKSDNLEITADIIYAVLFPLSYVWIGDMLYNKFVVQDSVFDTHCCERLKSTFSTGSEPERTPLVNHSFSHKTTYKISNEFAEPFCNMFANLTSCATFKWLRIGKCLKYCKCGYCFLCKKYKCNEECHCVREDKCLFLSTGLKFLLSFLMNLIFCLFPIVPFSCNPNYIWKDCVKNHTTSCTVTICKCIKVTVVTFIIYILSLRPIISTFTFILRSFTYFVFVALLVRLSIMRYTLLFVTTFLYFVKYLLEIINMNVDILNYILEIHNNHKKIEEKTFNNIYIQLTFVRKRLYLTCLQFLIVFMYLIITVETFIREPTSLTGSDSEFEKILHFLFFIIGPYAVSFFLKFGKKSYLSEDNKNEIIDKYKKYLRQEISTEI